jgi:hypothetical protein
VKEIPHDELRSELIPDPDGPWWDIVPFAHTFKAYKALGSVEAVGDLANRRDPEGLEELRSCLFFEARRWRHFGADPDGDELEYIRSFVRRIKELVEARERK